MNDDLRILLSAMLDESKTAKIINSQLEALEQRLSEVHISIDFGDVTNSLNKTFSELNKVIKEISNQVVEFKGLTGTATQIGNLSTDLEYVQQQLKDLGEVSSLTQIFDDKGNSKGFTVQLEKVKDNLKEITTVDAFRKLNEETKQLETVFNKVNTKVEQTKTELNELSNINLSDSTLALKNELESIISSQKAGIISLEEQIKRFQNAIYQNDNKTLNIDFEKLPEKKRIEYIGKLISAQKDLETQQQKQLKAEDAELTNLTRKEIAIDKIYQKLNSLQNTSVINSSQFDDVNKLVEGLKKLEAGSGEFKRSLAETNNELSKLVAQDRKISNLGQTMRNLGQLFAIGTPILVTRRAMTDMVKTINDFNSSLTEIRIVSGMSYEDVTKLRDGYNDLGKAIGATTKEVMNSAIEFTRQGRNLKETEALLTSSIIGAKLSGIDTSSMTNYLTAAVNGFEIEADRAISVIDKLVAVDNTSASSMSELATAMSRTSKSAQMAGVDIDSLVGYIATITSVTRKSAETVGESLKTIFTRYQDIKIGDFVEDGMVISDVRKTLENVGIALMETETDFRNFGDVLDDLSKKWHTLSDAEKASIGKALAGTRQRENFLVLMDNMSLATELSTNALESNGLALERYDIYLESTEAKLSQLRATLEGAYSKTLDSTFVNNMIDMTRSVVEFIDTTQGLIPILGTLGAAFGALKFGKNVGGTKIKYSCSY